MPAIFEEAEHPRAGKGSPGGGQFVSKGGSVEQPAGRVARAFVSPNVGNLTFEQAQSELHGRRQKLLIEASDDIDGRLGLEGGEHQDVIGAWTDGAENSLMISMTGVSRDEMLASAAMKGWLADQKSVLVFEPDEHGNHFMAKFAIAGKIDDIHRQLLEDGLSNHTLEPSESGATVHVFGRSQTELNAVDAAAGKYGTKAEVTIGSGEFVGTSLEEGSDREQRDDARKVYERIISEISDRRKLRGRDVARVWQDVRARWSGEFSPQGEVEQSVVTGIDQVDAWKETAAPKKTKRGYKVFNTDADGNLYPAMVRDKRAIPVGKWIAAEFRGKDPNLKDRPGWHMTELPMAPQMRSKKTGKMDPKRVWAEVDMGVDTEIKPGKQGLLGKTPKFDEFYQHKQGGRLWLIGGAVRINKILSDAQVAKILNKAGFPEDAKAEQRGDELSEDKPIETSIDDNVFRNKWETNTGYNLQPEGQLDALQPKARLWSQSGSVEDIKRQGTQAILHYGHMTGREHAVAIQVSGKNTTDNATPVMMLEGDDNHIDVPSKVVEQMGKEDSAWEYDHYHPDPLPLSASDMNALNHMAGLLAIHEHDNEGGSSTITLPNRTQNDRGHWNYDRFKQVLYESDDHARMAFYSTVPMALATEDSFDAANFLATHARNMALSANKLINYSYGLSENQRGWMEKYRDGYDKLEASVRQRVGTLVAKHNPQWEGYAVPPQRLVRVQPRVLPAERGAEVPEVV